MTDWTTISALATAGGTLVLAVATFASVRSANRSARAAERALQVGLRPLLMPSRLEDPTQKIRWVDEHWVHLDGGRASVEVAEENIYLAMSVRNAGNGIAVLQSWHIDLELWKLNDPHARMRAGQPPPGQDQFRRQTRDLYIPAGDIGFWQAAIRDANDDLYPGLLEAIQQRQTFTIDILYGDHEGGQRAISRFTVTPARDSQWLCSVARHWNLDRPDPR
jgi:hypothetical protein